MLRYEMLLLAVPEITKDEVSTLEKEISSLVKKNKGGMISFERWGKFRLAYPVRKNDYGVYFLPRFEVGGDQAKQLLDDISSFLRLKQSDVVMRDMVHKLTEHESLEYKRPDSLEETPNDVDSFMKANKMGGFSSGRRGPRAPRAEKPAVVRETVEVVKADS